jgi:hypothetical protein
MGWGPCEWGNGEGIPFQESQCWKNASRVQEGIRVGCSPSLLPLPRFMGLNTDSLSLSTKLINSLRVQPDKLLINWLHCLPPHLPALVQLLAQVLGPNPGPASLSGLFLPRDPWWDPRFSCSPGSPGHSGPSVPSLSLPQGMEGILRGSQHCPHPHLNLPSVPASLCCAEGEGGPIGPIISPH